MGWTVGWEWEVVGEVDIFVGLVTKYVVLE